MGVLKTENRLGETNVNHQGCLMKIVEYNNANNIIIEFQDDHLARVHTTYQHFMIGDIKNPYYPTVFNVGMIGNKYPLKENNKQMKEYNSWKHMLCRCYDEKRKNIFPTYKNAACCTEWLLYENFYEWLHLQDNFEKWLTEDRWHLDKDILIKGNKLYSPDTCCLVPHNVNILFTKDDAKRGAFPIGVCKFQKWFMAQCLNPFTNKYEYLGTYDTPEKAFRAYKKYKENIIKQVAQIEYKAGNITSKCYEAMMNYVVEITD